MLFVIGFCIKGVILEAYLILSFIKRKRQHAYFYRRFIIVYVYFVIGRLIVYPENEIGGLV